MWTGAGKACASVVSSIYEDWLSTHEAPAHNKSEENNIAERLTELEKGKKSDTLKRARESVASAVLATKKTRVFHIRSVAE